MVSRRPPISPCRLADRGTAPREPTPWRVTPRAGLSPCTEAIALHRTTGDHDGLAYGWESLGDVHRGPGDLAAAMVCYDRAVELHRTFGDVHNETQTLDRLGDMLHARDDGANDGVALDGQDERVGVAGE